eukprot:11120445-Heterocapsa_arctica.AAC.1
MGLSKVEIRDLTELKYGLWLLHWKIHWSGVVHKGKHSDLCNRTKNNIDKLNSSRWVIANLKVEKAKAAGFCYEDWLGNDHADKQARGS